MKSLRTYLYYGACLFLLASCSSMGSIQLKVFQPALIRVPSSIKTIGIVNRYLGDKEKVNKVVNTLESVVTGEGIHGDKEGSQAAVDRMKFLIDQDPRFDGIQLPENAVPGSGGEGIPAQLSVNVLDSLAQIYKVDAFLVLENLDSDVQRNNQPVSGPGGVPSIRTTMNVWVNAYWRFYDMQNKNILDEVNTRGNLRYSADAMSAILATGKLPMAKTVVADASRIAANNYSIRLVDQELWVGRSYFKRGSDALKTSGRMARLQDWDGAYSFWVKEVQSTDSKAAGRASYNLALYYEIKGDLDKAIKYAGESYSLYNQKKALYYSNILKDRKRLLENANMDDQNNNNNNGGN